MIRAALFSTLLLMGFGASAQLLIQEEPLMGHMVTEKGVHIQVRSGGCTEKNDFQVKIQRAESEGAPTVVSFVRINVDPCLALLPYGKILTYSFEELGLKHNDLLKIHNPNPGVRIFDDVVFPGR